MSDLKVFILGAGCSANCGYPLATQFIPTLKEFSAFLALKSDCAKIKLKCDKTIDYLKQSGASTVAELVATFGAKAHDFSQTMTTAERQILDCQIDDAKIATYALFLHLEDQAKLRLSRYDNFLRENIGQPPQWQKTLSTTNVRVLTFNYDRLFELAFVRGCGWDVHQKNLYGSQAML